MLPYVLIVFTVVVFVGAILQLRRNNREMEPIRESAKSENIIYRAPVHVKTRLWSGWSQKTLAGMEVIVRTHSIQIGTITPLIGRSLGSEWHMDSTNTSMEMSRRPSLVPRRDWIVLSAEKIGTGLGELQLAIAPRERLTDTWNALVSSGVQISSPPPD